MRCTCIFVTPPCFIREKVKYLFSFVSEGLSEDGRVLAGTLGTLCDQSTLAIKPESRVYRGGCYSGSHIHGGSMTVSFRFIAALLLLLSASSGAESVQEYGETGLQDLQTRSIEDSMVQMEVAEISDDDDDDTEGALAPIRIGINGTTWNHLSGSHLSFKCGNIFNVAVFRELNKLLDERFIPIVCEDSSRIPLLRISEDHCRLGVTHNICEAIPDQCGPDLDQVMVFGGPVENKYVADTHTPESMAYMLHHFFKQYINNSEAASMSWVAKRACTEKKGASLLMVAVHHVDMGEDAVLPGDIIYHPELGSLQVEMQSDLAAGLPGSP